MRTNFSRRSFLRTSALAAGALSAGQVIGVPNILAAPLGGDKLNCALIGCGSRAMSHLDAIIGRNQNLVAIVDPDEKRHEAVQKWLKEKNVDSGKLRVFTDYRQMFEKVGKEIDAAFIASPNHHHALPAMIAMQLGKSVYCEKPVCHDIDECRKLRAMARQSKVATQMGAQGHCMEGYRALCEYIWAGAIGKVTEVHSWTDRANGGAGPRPPAIPAPAGMHWDEWIGPARSRDFHADLHPHEWHGWYDFGNGSIGNMGCHLLDGAVWALKIEHPTSIEAEQIRGGSDERYPLGSRIRWDVPARGELAPVKIYWYDGLNQTTQDEPFGTLHAARGEARNFPPILAEIRAKYPDEKISVGDGFTLYIGDKGIIFTSTYGRDLHFIPASKMQQTPQPPKSLSRPKEVFFDFIDACLAGKKETASDFEYGTRLTEFTLLGNLAQRAGVGKKVEWDGPNMKVTNLPELNRWVKPEYRKGWQV